MSRAKNVFRMDEDPGGSRRVLIVYMVCEQSFAWKLYRVSFAYLNITSLLSQDCVFRGELCVL